MDQGVPNAVNAPSVVIKGKATFLGSLALHLSLAQRFGISLAQLPCEQRAFRLHVRKFLDRFLQALVEKGFLVDKAIVSLRRLLNLVHKLRVLLPHASDDIP